MATITLSDGRVVPVVKPHIGDQMELERQMKAIRKDYGPSEFKEDLKLSGFQTAFALFASFNRAGIHTTIEEVLALDLDELGHLVSLDPGDNPDTAAADEESEGEQSGDPQSARTGDAASE